MHKYVIERDIPGAGNLSAPITSGHFTEVLQHPEGAWSTDSVGRELCHR